MRAIVYMVLSAILATSALAQEAQPRPAIDPKLIRECSDTPTNGVPSCNVSKQDQKAARKEFERGMKYRKSGDIRASFESFREAAKLNPADVEYITLREILKQQLVLQTLERANQDAKAGRQIEAMAGMQYALEVDPNNEFAKKRTMEMLGELPSVSRPPLMEDKFSAARELHAQPKDVKKDFKYRGEARQLMTQVAAAYGLTAIFDESVKARNVRMEVDAVDFATAMRIVTKLTKTFWTPLDARTILFAEDSDQNRRALEHTAMRTYYVPDATSPQELTDIVNAMRILFEVRFVTQQPSSNTISVRAPSPVLDTVSEWLDSLSSGRPQVTLEVQTFSVSRNLTRQLGINTQPTFTLFNVPTEAKNLLGNRSIQDIINQLISSGAINQAGNVAIGALIAQALGGSGSPLLSNGFATFGGGTTLMGLALPKGSASFSASRSDVQTLEHVTVRASQGNPAVVKFGERFPILNSSYAPIFNTAAIAQVLQNGSFQAPFPSFNYEDLGIDLKATPRIHRDEAVTLDVELRERALSSQTLNGAPVISNREYTGAITLRDGEPAVIAGMITHADQRSVNGMPFFSRIPLANYAFTQHDKTLDESELLIVITPHITRMVEQRGPVQLSMPPVLER